MNIFRQRSLILIVLAIASSVYATATYVGRPEVKVSLLGTVERENQQVQLEKAGQLNPGEVLSWTITSQNAGSAPARNYKTVGEVPPGTVFVSNSARAENAATITYSIDKGISYEAKPMIAQKQPDGTTRKTPAPASLYTHVRYEWNEPLNEGKQVSAYYKVRIK